MNYEPLSIREARRDIATLTIYNQTDFSKLRPGESVVLRQDALALPTHVYCSRFALYTGKDFSFMNFAEPDYENPLAIRTRSILQRNIQFARNGSLCFPVTNTHSEVIAADHKNESYVKLRRIMEFYGIAPRSFVGARPFDDGLDEIVDGTRPPASYQFG